MFLPCTFVLHFQNYFPILLWSKMSALFLIAHYADVSELFRCSYNTPILLLHSTSWLVWGGSVNVYWWSHRAEKASFMAWNNVTALSNMSGLCSGKFTAWLRSFPEVLSSASCFFWSVVGHFRWFQCRTHALFISFFEIWFHTYANADWMF